MRFTAHLHEAAFRIIILSHLADTTTLASHDDSVIGYDSYCDCRELELMQSPSKNGAQIECVLLRIGLLPGYSFSIRRDLWPRCDTRTRTSKLPRTCEAAKMILFKGYEHFIKSHWC
jgi:hypothetical protein